MAEALASLTLSGRAAALALEEVGEFEGIFNGIKD
jgi:hypothetical protein